MDLFRTAQTNLMVNRRIAHTKFDWKLQNGTNFKSHVQCRRVEGIFLYLDGVPFNHPRWKEQPAEVQASSPEMADSHSLDNGTRQLHAEKGMYRTGPVLSPPIYCWGTCFRRVGTAFEDGREAFGRYGLQTDIVTLKNREEMNAERP